MLCSLHLKAHPSPGRHTKQPLIHPPPPQNLNKNNNLDTLPIGRRLCRTLAFLPVVLLLLVGAREADAQTPSLTASLVTGTTATLTLANHSTAWWLKRTTPADTTCKSKGTTLTEDLTSLTAATKYIYRAYSDSTCTTEITKETFWTEPPSLTVTSLTATTATLTLANHSTAWWLKRTEPTGDTTCKSKGTTLTEDLTNLTTGAYHTYKAYSANDCAAANEIASERFLTSTGTPGITLSPTTQRIAVMEGGSRTYTVKLQSTPTDDVTVTLTRTPNDNTSLGVDTDPDTTGDQNMLTFTTTNWFIAQPVTLTHADGASTTSSKVHVTHTASGGGYGSAFTKDMTVLVAAKEHVGIVLSESSVSVPEQGTCSASNPTYTVKLLSQPASNCTQTKVFVYIQSSCLTCDPDITVDAGGSWYKTLTFTRDNWDTAQPVCLSAADDTDVFDDTATITHLGSQVCLNNYNGVYAFLTATEADNDRTVVLSSGTSADVTEGGNVTYTAKLGGPPSAPVTVTVTKTSGGDASLTVDTDTGTTGDQSTFTFTTTNYDTTQDFKLSAAEDDDPTHGTAEFVFTPAGGDFGSADKATLTVRETDNDKIRPKLSGDALSGDNLDKLLVDEGGTAEVSVELEAQPDADVTVDITEQDTFPVNPNTDTTVDTDPHTPGDQTTLTFTSTNWNTRQTAVFATADDDDLLSYQERFRFQAKSGNKFFEYTDLYVTEREDDILVLTEPTTDTVVTAVTVVKGAAATYRVELAPPAPTEDVTVTLTSGNTDTATVNPTSLTFTALNWNQAQTVTVTGVESGVTAIAHSVDGGGHTNVTESAVAVTVEIRLTASSITQTTAKLTIQGHIDDQSQTKAWWYKRTTPTGDDTCTEVVAGTATADLTGLTASTEYTYTAYSATGCADADKIVSGTFRTLAPPTGGGGGGGGGGGAAEPSPVQGWLESPANGATVSGVDVIRGWSFAEARRVRIEQVTLYIDGRRVAVIPCCSARADVAGAYPRFPRANTGQSGWGITTNWGNLTPGQHTVRVVVTSTDEGRWVSDRHTITVFKPGDIAFADRFSLTEAQARIEGNHLVLDGVVLRDKVTQAEQAVVVRYAWQTGAQGLRLVASRTLQTARVQPWGLERLLAGLWRWLRPRSVTANEGITAFYEAPADHAQVVGIDIIRGWAFPDEPTDRIATVTVQIDETGSESAPCCSTRQDVVAAYPEQANAELSGWGVVTNYGNLAAGEHTLTVQIETEAGVEYREARTVTVSRLGGYAFVDRFDLSGATVALEDEEIVLSGVRVRDKETQQEQTIAVWLQWSAAVQGLVIVDTEIVP